MPTSESASRDEASPQDAAASAETRRFSVGYRPLDTPGGFPDLIRRFRAHVREVYFAWADLPSGRSPLITRTGYTDWALLERLEQDLRELRRLGIRLHVLFNANCYGRHAMSVVLENRVRSTLDYLSDRVGKIDGITTTSPAVAHVVKRDYPDVEVRASVNMRIGSVQGMTYLSDLFDSFHVQRDFQRNLDWLGEFSHEASRLGKRVVLLANSGCLRFCPGQTFHDNMVAHEAEISETINMTDLVPYVCARWYQDRDPRHRTAALQSTWIRPENLEPYAARVHLVKLATRMHGRPDIVLRAYASGAFRGNLLDLFEPSLNRWFAPLIIDNSRFPDDWLERTSTCDGGCHRCNYCAAVLDRVLVDPTA